MDCIANGCGIEGGSRRLSFEPAASFLHKVLTEYTYDTLGNLKIETIENKSVDYMSAGLLALFLFILLALGAYAAQKVQLDRR